MIDELDPVILLHDIADRGLQRGDVGAVVHKYADGQTFEVEFVTAEGETIALLTLGAEALRPMSGNSILHMRDLVPISA